ncbi:hypothetical protein FB45DRAFT_918975 [Roridomyces roridus]|uniref:Secreted protein n=1 Tax=Roridomyces roridus TaxID=1738132 RepID=A0AAD7FN76_9AGAR|nr:hypothetical protein FB45DRAFT_918975 [Roridomyces roridus]
MRRLDTACLILLVSFRQPSSNAPSKYAPNQLQSCFINESRVADAFIGGCIEYFFSILNGLLQCGGLASGSTTVHQVANKGENCDGQCGVAQDVVGDEGNNCSRHEG